MASLEGSYVTSVVLTGADRAGCQAPMALSEPEQSLRRLVKHGLVGADIHPVVARSRSFVGQARNVARKFAAHSFSIARSTRWCRSFAGWRRRASLACHGRPVMTLAPL